MIYYFLDKTFKNILLKNFNVAFINELNNLATDINNIFNDADSHIKKMLLKKKIKTRHKKITFIDALCYIFNYSFIHPSKQTVISNLTNRDDMFLLTDNFWRIRKRNFFRIC